jgi:hypothetical protein
MLAVGMIAARLRSTVELDSVSQMLEKLHNGGLRGKAVIRLQGGRFSVPRLAVPMSVPGNGSAVAPTRRVRAMASEAIRDRIANKPISTDPSQAEGRFPGAWSYKR